MLKIEIPKSKEKIKQQISALEWQIRQDNEQDRKIHDEALYQLKRALNEIEKQ